MTNLKELTTQEIEAMNYNMLIGLVRETNRPPGGLSSIATIAQRAFLRPEKRVLEIGTSTGVTAIELALTTGVDLTSIDINEDSLVEAKRRAEKYGVQSNIKFEHVDALNMPYTDGSFDLVFVGNVTSLLPNRNLALQEYTRVLKQGGSLAAIPMYYLEDPSQDLVKKVSQAIGVNITPHKKEYWSEFFDVAPLQPYWCEDYGFDRIQESKVDDFVNELLKRPHLDELQPKTREKLAEKYREYMHLFRENLSIMGYSLMLFRKEPEEFDQELFTARRIQK